MFSAARPFSTAERRAASQISCSSCVYSASALASSLRVFAETFFYISGTKGPVSSLYGKQKVGMPSTVGAMVSAGKKKHSPSSVR